MKKTPLYEEHKKLGASIVEFGGWLMPVQYTNIIDEHNTTRTKAGLFDICHMGEFFVKGKDAKAFLQFIVTNDIEKIHNSKCFYTAMCNRNGGVIDDLFVYKFSDEKFMLVVNAGTIEKDFKHLIANMNDFDVEIENESNNIAKLDLQGPLSQKILQKILKFDIMKLERFHFIEDKLRGNRILISRTGYTGEDGFELYVDKENAVELWNEVLDVGNEDGLKPVGLGARDTLRLEPCYSLYGHELTEDISPIEAGIGFVVKINKKEDFIGKDILKKQIEEGTKKNLISIEMADRGILREGYKIFKNDKEIGYITSGTFSPTLKKSIALGFVDAENSIKGAEFEVDIRGKKCRAKIVEKPFYFFNGDK